MDNHFGQPVQGTQPARVVRQKSMPSVGILPPCAQYEPMRLSASVGGVRTPDRVSVYVSAVFNICTWLKIYVVNVRIMVMYYL